MNYSVSCLTVGEELALFLRKRPFVNIRQYQRKLSSYGLAYKQQRALNLKYHYDTHLRTGSVYLPMYSFNSNEYVTSLKYDDQGRITFFEVTDDEQATLYSSTRPFTYQKHNQKLIVLISVDIDDFFLMSHFIEDLGLMNIVVLFAPGYDSAFFSKVVHEQLNTRKVIVVNPTQRHLPALQYFEINIKGYASQNIVIAKNKFVALLLKSVKSL